MKAADFTTAEILAKDIKTLVPPILEHSRKLQMDPRHLESHPWLRYLKPLPQAAQVWDENRRLIAKPAAQ
ncbi:hypothetical protein TDMWS_13380 [Thermodesulfomicrobium sp. WS]|nr:hypothetical protein TDMWS_13380 [Thermodesulfomicrobium sp. WS]